ncbi:hypothetical protein NHX12_031120 [Muraenolepis orangiensis]|uniref:Uncharacterized protein n=1 Tax=Muraenolepis orangiensis TaxID=630683 RepID=A0A9Q0ED53_9TELE|nr:hypothetical protein NHX12_031120 [Muraenolepis orangiensis]
MAQRRPDASVGDYPGLQMDGARPAQLGLSRSPSKSDSDPEPDGDPAPGHDEAGEKCLLPGQRPPPRSPSFASEWDEVISGLWVGLGNMLPCFYSGFCSGPGDPSASEFYIGTM